MDYNKFFQKQKKVIISIDAGTKYCGLAVKIGSSPVLGLSAIYFNRDFQLLKKRLTQILQEYLPNIIVIGKSTKHQSLNNLVQKHYMPIIKEVLPKVQILFIDEESTTTLAYVNLNQDNNLTAKKKNKLKQNGIIDSTSAIILLEKAYELIQHKTKAS